MSKNWKQVKISQNVKSLIWISLKSAKKKPIIVIQTEPEKEMKLNFKSNFLNVEIEKL